ncbi:hypothetical protein [Paraburkholderia sp. RL17-337-BIB-A]|uniref:hypothetical protein n=1 Tax=Paraburkholderia sp. RL17-337-BIB-A TaxID=3031636 RepID=UPI0038BA824D
MEWIAVLFGGPPMDPADRAMKKAHRDFPRRAVEIVHCKAPRGAQQSIGYL